VTLSEQAVKKRILNKISQFKEDDIFRETIIVIFFVKNEPARFYPDRFILTGAVFK
jgi:hypothetical protein